MGAQHASLYDEDFDAWLARQAGLLRAGDVDDLDRDLIAEELEAMTGDRRRETTSRLTRLFHHLLKWEYQPSKRSPSWVLTIREQRRQLREMFEQSGTLENYGKTRVDIAYRDARGDAAVETELPLKSFPEDCPYTFAQAVDEDFWPGQP